MYALLLLVLKQRAISDSIFHLPHYRVAGTVGLMTIPVLGTAPGVEFDEAAEPGVALGIALQLTNIIRDVGEDIGRKRIYIPQDDMDAFGVKEDDLTAAKALPVGSGRYEELMEFQIQRALAYYAQAEAGVKTLAPSSRLPVLVTIPPFSHSPYCIALTLNSKWMMMLVTMIRILRSLV